METQVYSPSMPAISYTVIATFLDEATCAEYAAWLQDGHIDQVLSHGGDSATLVRMDRATSNDPIRLEVRYIFPTRGVFDRYVEHHAPALRADGLKRFPQERGVSFARTVGEVV